MNLPKRTLHDEIFAVFERACREGDLVVAEHLLRTLEADARQHQSVQNLDRAYLLLTRLR
ncbi:hypothetical protein AQ920_18725 [Burkholderia pseudomallei]|nr:hypothetical protein AQ920_18725 [Burkholderia pseudomallei]